MGSTLSLMAWPQIPCLDSVTREPRALVATDRAYGRRELRVELTAGREPQTEISAKGKLWWLRPKQSSRSLYIQSTQLASDRQA